MRSPLHTVRDLPVYRTVGDLPLDDNEHGDLAAVVGTPGVFMWHEELPGNGTWWPLGGDPSLPDRVAAIEQRLACLADCFARPVG